MVHRSAGALCAVVAVRGAVDAVVVVGSDVVAVGYAVYRASVVLATQALSVRV